ncbi:MAG: hypothetical protein ACYDBB_25225, partial [Armatimonadota bacterium]
SPFPADLINNHGARRASASTLCWPSTGNKDINGAQPSGNLVHTSTSSFYDMPGYQMESGVKPAALQK